MTNRPVKVLMLIPGIGAGGGAERSLVESAPGLRAQGIDLHVAYFVERPNSAVGRLRSEGTPVRRIEATGWLGRIAAVRRLLRDLRPEILHTSLFEADIVGRIAAIGTPATVLGSLVQANHDPLRRRDPTYSAWRIAVVRAIEGVTARRLMHHAVANSDAARWAAVRGLRIDPDQVTVIHRGRAPASPIDREEARRSIMAELGIRGPSGSDAEAGPRLLLNVGRHEFQKDHGTLVDAVARLRRDRPDLDIHLLIAGREGVMTPRLRWRIAATGTAERIHLLGPRHDIAELLAAVDRFVFPSILEGLPGAVIEAMAAGTPTVASAIAANTELLEPDDAVLVAPTSASELADGIAASLDDPDRSRQMAESARRRFQAEFTLDRAVADTASLYRRLANA